jgi:hypothetical protein
VARGRRRQRPGSAGKARQSSAGARACSVIDGVLDAAFPHPKDDVLECRTATGSAGGGVARGAVTAGVCQNRRSLSTVTVA